MSCRYEADQGYVRADGVDCFERHCLSCGSNHVDRLTCPRCVGKARDLLHRIGELCGDLPAEVEARGVHSAAMNLLGPACDPEARGHLEASVAAGRVPADYLDTADDENHPLLALGNSQMEWEDVLGHESVSRVTVGGAIHYLGANLTDMAQNEMLTVTDHWAAWAACVGRLESVLHASERRRTGAPCPDCDPPRALIVEQLADEAVRTCMGCRRVWDEEQYADLVAIGAKAALPKAEWLTAAQCEEVHGVKAARVRKWQERGQISSRWDAGRVVYRAADVVVRLEAKEAMA